ncbi:MAG: aminotransferase class IV, partial [Pseudomonadota bacterium]
MSIAYLNGTWDKVENMKVSVLDRGFLFADSVYEVIPGYYGTPLFLEAHWARLCANLKQLNIENPLSVEAFSMLAQRLIDQTTETPCVNVYVQITRGVQKKRAHALEQGEILIPTVFAVASPYTLFSDDALAEGFSGITMPDDRWSWGSIKSTSLLANTLAAQAAKVAGAHEAFLIHDGFVVEGAASNIFMVKDGAVYTPPLTTRILAGITRAELLDLLKKHNVPFEEELFTLDELYNADECWMSGSLHGPRAITRLDGRTIGT